jgi:hypothetical protein
MNEQHMNPSGNSGAAEAGAAHERCLCYEVFDLFRSRIGVSPRVKEHLANSRIELLKAVRAVIDERIEHLSKPAQQGTRIRVE